MKRCNGPCKQVKEDQKFYTKRYASGASGLRAYCIECGNAKRQSWRNANKARDNARNNDYNKRNARRIRGHKLLKYWPDLTTPEQALDRFDDLLFSQRGTCAICSRAKRLAVDHCHVGGQVRGLLCNSCNRGLGLFQDSPELLQKALAYKTKAG